MKILCGFLCVLLFLFVSGCDVWDEFECSIGCTSVFDKDGYEIECHCPNN